MAASSRASLRTIAPLVAAVFIAGLSACNSTPTEPLHPSTVLTVDVGWSGSGGGSALAVRADTCECSRAALDVKIDGVVAGSVGCGEDRTFSLSDGEHLVELISPSLGTVTRGTFTITKDSGPVIRVRCT
jgi:hypothetical protein